MKYLYIHNGAVVAGGVKPETGADIYYKGHDHFQRINADYKYIKWEESLMPVKNAWYDAFTESWKITTVINEADYDQIITPGTLSEGHMKNGEWVVTKII